MAEAQIANVGVCALLLLTTPAKHSEFDFIHFPENLGLAYFTLMAKKQRQAFANSVIVIGTHGPHVWER